MIRRMLRVFRCRQCSETIARLDAARRQHAHSQSDLQSAALDVMNESRRPPIPPYTLDQLGCAVADAVSRAAERKEFRLQRLSDPVEQLAADALTATARTAR